MARSDYRLCDVCDEKAFYDAELAYDHGPGEFTYAPPYKVAGEPQYADPEMAEKHGLRIGFLGDWSVICKDCAKTHRTRIEPIAAAGCGNGALRDAETVAETVLDGQTVQPAGNPQSA